MRVPVNAGRHRGAWIEGAEQWRLNYSLKTPEFLMGGLP